MYNLGLNLTAYQITTLIMIFVTTIVSIKKRKNLFYLGNKYIVFFLFYAIVTTIVISVFFIDNFLQTGGFFRSEGRYLAQLLLLLMTFSIIPLAFNYINSTKDVYHYLKTYLYALILLVILGWAQFFIYQFTHLDIFPLGSTIGDLRSGMWDNIFRMSSLGGEPKALSISLIIGFFIIKAFNRYDISFIPYEKLLKYIFLFTAFATLSTSGMVLFVILFLIDSLYIMVTSKIKIKFDVKKTIYLFSIMLVIGFLFFKYWDFISLIVEKRVLERDIASEDFDAPIQIFLVKFPEYILFGSGLGNIHNFAYPYISAEHLHYMKDSIFVAKSGYLKIISEQGLFGFTLFTFIFYTTYRNLGKVRKYLSVTNQQFYRAMQLILLIVLMAYFARTYVVNELILLLALANVLIYSKRIKHKEIT